jgi:integrase/recombinase XerD
MLEDMRMRKLAPKTQTGYVRAVKRLAGFLGRSPDMATVEDLRQFQLYLIDHGTSPITLNATLTGLKLFFEATLDRAEVMAKVRSARVARKLPVVLSREEGACLIAAAPGLKYQAAFSVAYGGGLRASEMVGLKVGDIDSRRMTLRVEQGKDRKASGTAVNCARAALWKRFGAGITAVRTFCSGWPLLSEVHLRSWI